MASSSGRSSGPASQPKPTGWSLLQHRCLRDGTETLLISAERVSAAAYGTVLTLATLPFIRPQDVADGAGWELVVGIGGATWLAHLFAEVVGDHVRHTAAAHERAEITRAMVDGLPILLAVVPPAAALLLGRLQVLSSRTALWAAVTVGLAQLVGLGAFVGTIATERRSQQWLYAGVTALFGLVVVLIKVILGH
jgi:hypothetical protein